MLTAAKKKTTASPSVTNQKTPAGRVAATITRSIKYPNVAFDIGVEPKFAEFVASQLDDLYKTFHSRGEAHE